MRHQHIAQREQPPARRARASSSPQLHRFAMLGGHPATGRGGGNSARVGFMGKAPTLSRAGKGDKFLRVAGARSQAARSG